MSNILSGHDQLPQGVNSNSAGFIWTDDLVKKYAEVYRFSSSRTSIEQFKENTDWLSQESVNTNYDLAMQEVEGKEAVELLSYIRDNHFSIGDDGLWYNNSLDYMVLTDEQLIENFKIWKAEDK